VRSTPGPWGAPIGMAVLAGDRVVSCNPLFAAVLRAEQADLVGEPLGRWLAPEDRVELADRLARPADDREGRVWSPVAGLAPDGGPWVGDLLVGDAEGDEQVVVLVVSSGPLAVEGRGSGGPVFPAPGTRYEVDRVLSHDVRGGLRGTNSFLTLLDRELSGSVEGQAAEYLHTAAAAALRTDTMVERLVHLLRVADAAVTLRPTAVDGLVGEVVATSLEAFPGAAPDLEVGTLPTVWADRSLLVGCLAELVTNARKFEGAHLGLSVDRVDDGWAYLVVSDDGPGIQPDLAEDAFRPFRLLQAKGRFPGVGMGLPTCRAIARVHAGRCWIDPSPAVGARVLLRLAVA